MIKRKKITGPEVKEMMLYSPYVQGSRRKQHDEERNRKYKKDSTGTSRDGRNKRKR